MPHHTPLIATIVAGIVVAFLLGAVAQRFRLSPLVGYLLAGVLVGPFTPGFVADQDLATELAEIGVILLMFGVGLHFSIKDLMKVRALAIPGALGQMAAATLMGVALALALGWSLVAGIVFGLALSVASTVVLLRALQEQRIVQTDRGKIAVGWLIVEDLAMVLALVMLPALAGAMSGDNASGTAWIGALGLTLAKVAAFVALMLIVGRKVVPWMLHWAAHTGSRELFRLAVLAIALGIAFGAAVLFDVSFALGAFFAGMILAESELSHRAAEETLPLRDAFAVLFFVSVGMLFNPAVLIEQPLALAATVLIIVVGKSLAAWGIIRAFGHSQTKALTIAASLAQIGEFSFILAGLGIGLNILPPEGRDLILGGALISIMINPLLFVFAMRKVPEPALPANDEEPQPAKVTPTALVGHSVVVGFGRVGGAVSAGLAAAGETLLVLEHDDDLALAAERQGIEVLQGNAADIRVLDAAGLDKAARLFVAIPDAFEAGRIVERARHVNASLDIVVRAHSDEEVAHLASLGASEIVMGEREIARRMLERSSAPTTPPVIADPVPGGAEAERPILEDAELALLKAIRRLGIWPGEAVSRGQVLADGEIRLFSMERLDQAFDGLKAKACLQDWGDGRVSPTRAGFLAALGA
jgi:CPA2 family monovalent cation:H+ antiporter-2